MQAIPDDRRSGSLRRVRGSLGNKLLLLLLAFGLLPLSVTIVVGYAVSRSTILEQSRRALASIAGAQATHFTTELNRERLLLQTIAGQLPSSEILTTMPPQELAAFLVRSLPENGVFDGLRLAMADGRVLASVALGQTAPHWPPASPAADWIETPVFLHREDGQVLAYLVATTVSRDPAIWLEGHVRAEDFRRIFSVPQHLVAGVESVVFDRGGNPIFGIHEHAAGELAASVPAAGLDSAGVHLVHTPQSTLVAVAPVPESDWVFVAALPVAYALAPLSKLRTSATLGAFFLTLLIVITGILASRSVTTPLRDLATAAKALENEELFHPLPVHSSDEVGALIASFNAMALSLDRSREEVGRLHARDMERAQQLATVGELASGVAHEIRNPLTGVQGAIELALRRIPDGDASRPLLMEAQRQLKRIDTTTAQLLQYARPPALREITVDPAQLVERALAIVAPRASTAEIPLSVEPSTEPLAVHVDPELMVQVLVNLLLNGIEAMSNGGSLTVWVARHAPDVWIGVSDTGPGIAAEMQQELFRPFVTTKHQGTGLGLPISREIVNRHGGSLTLKSVPGEGATFVVTLPLAEGG
jgi:signal transduction histidine kinase